MILWQKSMALIDIHIHWCKQISTSVFKCAWELERHHSPNTQIYKNLIWIFLKYLQYWSYSNNALILHWEVDVGNFSSLQTSHRWCENVGPCTSHSNNDEATHLDYIHVPAPCIRIRFSFEAGPFYTFLITCFDIEWNYFILNGMLWYWMACTLKVTNTVSIRCAGREFCLRTN